MVAAARGAAAAGFGDVVSVDMGGTSYDVCLIRDGRPEVKSDWNWRHRYCIALPMVDVHSIGAGGGSLVRAANGAMTVGPESAGSVPGPVCYGRGGTEPTVTDADLVLGRLDRHRSGAAGSSWTWKPAIGSQQGWRAVGVEAESTAMAAIEIIDTHMSDAVRRVLSMAGADPRELDLVAFGGMGAVHAPPGGHPRYAPSPRSPVGSRSRPGPPTADHVVDDTRSLISDWREIDVERLDQLAADLQYAAIQTFRARDCPQVDFASIGVSTSSIPVRRSTSRFPWADPTVVRSPKRPSRPRSRSCIAATKKPG